MIKAKVSTDYKDIDRIFAGGSIQKEILKVWSTEADAYVFEAWRILEMEEPLPLTINANGEPLVDYLIYGNAEQTGTPTPENPIMPIGCGERTENLWDEEYLNGYYTSSGVFISANNQICSRSKIVVKPNTEYWMGVTSNLGTAFLGVVKYNKNAEFIGRESTASYKGYGVFFTTDASTYYININFGAYYGSVYNDDIIIAESSTPISYEPYGYKLPILSNSTVTNIYLGEAQTTRRIKKLVLTGEETFNKNTTSSSNYLYYSPRNTLLPNSIGKTPLICNELPVINEAPVSQIGTSSNNDFNVIYVNFGADVMNTQPSGNTADGLKEYLAAQYASGTPVTIWYVLAEPETGIVNEPLMKIDKYADTVSMEQAGVSIPTNKGTTILDYDRENRLITSDGHELVDKNQNGFLLSGSTLRPSKMYIKYKGR